MVCMVFCLLMVIPFSKSLVFDDGNSKPFPQKYFPFAENFEKICTFFPLAFSSYKVAEDQMYERLLSSSVKCFSEPFQRNSASLFC